MIETLRLMNACTSKKYLTVPFEELAETYQKTDSEHERNTIVRAIFCRLFPMFCKIYDKFPNLSNEVRVETILFSIIKVLKYWNTSKSKAKFTTYMYGCVKNQLKTEVTNLNCKKREVWQRIVDNDENGNNIHITNKADCYQNKEYLDFIENLKNATNLSSEEKEYCAYVLAGIVHGDEVDKKANYSERQKMFTDPILNKRPIRMDVSKIRQSLKKKFAEFDRELFYV